MRIVRDLADLSAEVEKAEAEALSAFGDGTVFVEHYVERGRHVEVQVWGDAEGNIAVLGERDCSIQRRHQKVVEEAPAPGKLSRGTRERLHAAARKAAEAISYRGAGTVEFLYEEERAEFWFLEMNTRLQVEHPVTEMVFHTDLVELQIRAAEGETSDVRYPDKPDGHAIEVRLYAEDPAQDYQPQSGLLTTFEIPTSRHVRVDTGFGSGNEVTTHYDAMLAKVVAYGSDRDRRRAPARRRAAPGPDPRPGDQPRPAGRDPRGPGLPGRQGQHGLPRHLRAADQGDRPRCAGGGSPRAGGAGRPGPHRPGAASRSPGATSSPSRSAPSSTARSSSSGGAAATATPSTAHTVVAASPTAVTLEADGVRTTYDVAVSGDAVDVDSPRGHVRLTRVPRFVDPADAVASGSLLAPMPGTVVRSPSSRAPRWPRATWSWSSRP